MRPTPLTSDEIYHMRDAFEYVDYEFARAIELEVNARWEKLLAEQEPCETETNLRSVIAEMEAVEPVPDDHELFQKALDALFYHTQQTRPIHSTNLIMEEISERLK